MPNDTITFLSFSLWNSWLIRCKFCETEGNHFSCKTSFWWTSEESRHYNSKQDECPLTSLLIQTICKEARIIISKCIPTVVLPPEKHLLLYMNVICDNLLPCFLPFNASNNLGICGSRIHLLLVFIFIPRLF